MSSWCGPDLEDYLMYEYDLIVDGDDSANQSLRICEILGQDTRRLRISAEEFAPLVELHEPFRDRIEYRLEDYNEETHGSWRDYAGYAFELIPSEVDEQAIEMVKYLRETRVNSQ